MHIVYVTGDFVETDGQVLGGMQNYIYKISKLVMQKGHDVTILAIGKQNKEWKYDGISVVTCLIPVAYLIDRMGLLYNQYYQYLLMPVLRELVFNHALNKINKKKKIGIVQYAGWFGVGMLYNRKYPSVLRISTYIKEQLPENYSARELTLITYCERMAAKRFDGIIAPSKTLGKKYGNDVKRKVRIIKTPFESKKEINEDSELYFSKLHDKKYSLFFGRLSWDKGIGTLVHAIPGILEKYPDVYFVLAGEIFSYKGYNTLNLLTHNLKEKRKRIIYLGNINHQQLIQVIRNAEAVVLPSLMYNLPNAGLEAMNYNGILIGTRGASFDEMITDGDSGFLIDVDNDYQLKEKIDIIENMTEIEKENMKKSAKKD